METLDQACSLHPYFHVPEENMEEFRKLCVQFMEKTKTEANCLYYGFSFNGLEVHCREAYTDADAVLNHLENIGELLQQALSIANVTRLEIHGVASELAKLKEHLKELDIQYFEVQYGFRN